VGAFRRYRARGGIPDTHLRGGTAARACEPVAAIHHPTGEPRAPAARTERIVDPQRLPKEGVDTRPMQTSSPPRSLSPVALRVRAVLNEWDPIGVHLIGRGWPDDEYDDLILPILEALDVRPSVDDLAAELRGVVEIDYGLPAPDGCHDVARSLLALPR
jgi:hypothetical protein